MRSTISTTVVWSPIFDCRYAWLVKALVGMATFTVGVSLVEGSIWESALVVAIVTGLFALLTEWFKAWLARQPEDKDEVPVL